jgi:ribosomal-protein-serine acetyltransferase
MLRRELPGGYGLRLLEEADAPELYDLIDANREHLLPWMPWVPGSHSAEDVLPFIRLTRRQIADNDGLQTAIVDPKGGSWA